MTYMTMMSRRKKTIGREREGKPGVRLDRARGREQIRQEKK
jgi:hypothetical protein